MKTVEGLISHGELCTSTVYLSVCRPVDWGLKLDSLVDLASKRVEERKLELARKTGAGPQAEVQRQARLWRLRLQLYCRMRENFQNTGQCCWVRLWFLINSEVFIPLELFHALSAYGHTHRCIYLGDFVKDQQNAFTFNWFPEFFCS